MNAYVILVEGKTWISALIKRESGSRFSHVGFAFVEDGITYEADSGGVCIRGLATYPLPYALFEVQGLTGVLEQEAALRRWCQSKIGVRYDYGKVVGMWLDRWFLRLGFPLFWAGFRRVLDHESAVQCVEYVDAGLRALPSPCPLSVSILSAAPGDLEHDPRLREVTMRG